MPAQKYNPDLLVAILNRLVTHPHCEIKATAREFKISPVTIFNWRAASARDEQADLKTASPFWVLWMDQASYWHRHLILARKLSILRIDERLRDLAVNGTKEFLFRQGGEPIWQVDPQLAADALDPKTWQERHGDRPITDVYKRGADGELLQAYREVPPNPPLLIKAVSALLPEIYGERVQHDVTVGGVLRLGAPAAAPKPIVEADFTVLAETPNEIKPPSNVLGQSFTWIGFEELTQYRNDQPYKQMLACLRSAVPNIPMRVRSTTNPDGPGHNWVRRRFKTIDPNGTIIGPRIEDEQGLPRRAIYATLAENQLLLATQPDYLANIVASAIRPGQLEAWTKGSWTISSGGMFDGDWPEASKRCVLPPIPPQLIPPSWRITAAFDWGDSKPFAWIWAAISDGSAPEIVSAFSGTVFHCE